MTMIHGTDEGILIFTVPPSLRPRAERKPLPGGMTALSRPVTSSTNWPRSPRAPMAPRRVKRMKKRRSGSAS
jgi:hypothetical protein